MGSAATWVDYFLIARGNYSLSLQDICNGLPGAGAGIYLVELI